MAPLAGKPPFATDEPDSFYETPRAPQPRIRQPAPPNPNNRTSAYDVYDNYLADDKNKLSAPAGPAASNRDSGIGALGMGLLNMGDDSDSDDDDEDIRPKPTSPPGIAPISKNAALAAATGVSAPSSPTRPNPPQAGPPQQSEQRPPQAMHPPNQGPPPQNRGFAPHPNQQPPHPQQHQQMMRGPVPPNQQQPRPVGPPHPQQQMPNQRPSHGPIAAPRPGYAAPIAALNLARPEAAVVPGGRQGGMPQPSRIQNPFELPFAGPGRGPGSPSPSVHSSTPHPLQPPVTPITPAFIRPASKSPSPINISFEEGVATPRKPIMRGNSEETLLPSRGEKGDDFWRRFSMVAKEDSQKKESSWLKKTRNGSDRLSRWVWIVGIILLLCIGGGAALGVYMTRKSPGHQQPTAIGGSADYTAGPTSSATLSKSVPKGSSTRLHVTPTNTVARRSPEDAFLTPAPAPTPALALRMHAKRRLAARDVW